MLSNLLHPSNDDTPILVNELGIVILIKLLHPINALLPIVCSVLVLGIVMLTNLLHP